MGRRGGKSRIAATVAVWLASRDYRPVLAAGEWGTLPLIATDRRQARTLFGYVIGMLHASPLLSRLIVRETADSVELTTRVRLEVHTASWRALRGYTVIGAVADEIAFWRTDDSANPDTEIINALGPAMATVPGALLVGISSPYSRRGLLWEQYRRYYGTDGDILIWQAATQAMNPSVPAVVIEKAYEEDESAASAEYGAQWRRDLEAYLSKESLEQCVIPGRVELPPVSSVRFDAFVDPSGGSQDSMTPSLRKAGG